MDNTLLEKYWNAETTPQEEAQLMQDMAQQNSPEAQYFAFLAKVREDKSFLSIDDIDAYNLKQTLHKPASNVRPLYRWMASAAAMLIFALSAFGVWNYSQQVSQQAPMAETFEDPYEAYEEVRQALAFVSSKLNKSQNEALVNIAKAGEYAEMFK